MVDTQKAHEIAQELVGRLSNNTLQVGQLILGNLAPIGSDKQNQIRQGLEERCGAYFEGYLAMVGPRQTGAFVQGMVAACYALAICQADFDDKMEAKGETTD